MLHQPNQWVIYLLNLLQRGQVYCVVLRRSTDKIQVRQKNTITLRYSTTWLSCLWSGFYLCLTRIEAFFSSLTVSVHHQSTSVVDLAGSMAELDSDMADITQGFPTESMLGGEDEGDLLVVDMDTTGGKLGGLISAEHVGVSASSQIVSALGINPHTLQVESEHRSTHRKSSVCPQE